MSIQPFLQARSCLTSLLAVLPLGLSRASAQEVFREVTYTFGATATTHFAELDPDTKRVFTGEHAAMATMKRHVPKSVALDLARATRAELSVEFWGGHIGTAGQRFRVNDHDWIDLPQPAGTPTEPQRFHRTLLGNNAAPIPLAHLRDGENVFRFTAGKQIAYANDWGFYWIYDFTARVYYDASKRPHPTGEMISPKAGSTFDDTLRLEVTASSPNGSITRVEFLGEYDDFDWDGDGVWREWQYSTNHGVLQHHLGTVTSPPWRVKSDTRWLPDQAAPIRVRARITDSTGLTYLTPPIDHLVQQRAHRGVRMVKCDVVPEKWMSRAGKESPKGSFVLTEADLAGATFARLIVSTWSGDVEDIMDVDGDEFADVIAMEFPAIYWLEATDRRATAWTKRTVAAAPRTQHVNSQGFTTGQIVPGGKPELVFATEDGIFYYEIPANPEAGNWPRTLITKDASDEGVDLADIDGDGLLDLVAGNNEKYLAWWKNPGNGRGNWTRHIIGTTAPHPVDRVRARDMNGDGRVDVVVTEERSPGREPDANLFWFEQPADPTTENWVRHRLITTWSLNNLDVADVDRDGDFDIVTGEHKGKDYKLYLFENDGRGSFTAHVIGRGHESHLGTQFADLDGDGDLDLVSIAWDNYKFLHVWRNDAK